jgi:hypothetical protein
MPAIGNHMLQEYLAIVGMLLITQSSLLQLAKQLGQLKIHGAQLGENKDLSDLLREIHAEFVQVHLSQFDRMIQMA